MGTSELGSWEPLELTDVVSELMAAPFRWWVSGGRALELHLGRQWREHDDTDVGVVRAELPQVFAWLSSWELHVAAAGTLTRWHGEPLRADRHQNNVWCRRALSHSWVLDLTVGDGSEADWIYRRDRNIRAPWDHAVLMADGRVPYLAPELQLLYKSTDRRAKDDLDAREVIPELEPVRRSRLLGLLPAGHPWARLAE